MKDYRIEITVRNNRIIEHMRRLDYATVAQLSRDTGIYKTYVYDYINFKKKPLDFKGRWKPTALKLAEVLACDPADLWTDIQREAVLKTNKKALALAEKEISGFFESPDPQRLLEEKQTADRIDWVLDTLPEMERNVLKMRFGLRPYYREHTLEEIANEYGLTRERIRQKEIKGIRRIRNSPTRQRKILEAMPFDSLEITEPKKFR